MGPLGLAATSAWLALSADEQAQALTVIRRALVALVVVLPPLAGLGGLLCAD